MLYSTRYVISGLNQQMVRASLPSLLDITSSCYCTYCIMYTYSLFNYNILLLLSSTPTYSTYDDDHHHRIVAFVKSWPRNNVNLGQWRISPTLLY